MLIVEVDGVDIDIIGNIFQEVFYIDQGEDIVILDLKGDFKEIISDSLIEEFFERRYFEINNDVVFDNDDENMVSVENVNDIVVSLYKVVEMSFDEFRMKLLQIVEFCLDF